MGTPYVQNFDSLSTGNLAGQDSWNAVGTSPTVSTAVSLSSPKSVLGSGSVGGSRDVTNQTSGTQYYCVYCDTMGSAGDGFPQRVLSETTAGKVYNKWQNVGGVLKFQYYNAGYFDMFTGTTGVWYIIELNFDCSTDTYTYRYKQQGGSFSSLSSAKNFLAAATNINRIYMEQDATWTTYVDSFDSTDPSPAAGPTGVKTWDDVTQSTGIKTYEDVALASTKSVIGVS